MPVHQHARHHRIIEVLARDGHATVAELAADLGSSLATVRRDLTALSNQRLLRRTHGGAQALGAGFELPLAFKADHERAAKQAIAAAVERAIRPGSAIGLNGGTTAYEVARAIARSARLAESGVSVTVVTNALNIAVELGVHEHVNLVVTGGAPRPKSYELVGPLAVASLGRVTLDEAVLGVDGLSAQFGATTVDHGEAEIGRAFAGSARRVTVVGDATKLGRSSPARMLPLSAIKRLVTSAPPPPSLAAALAVADVEVQVVLADPVGSGSARTVPAQAN